MVSQAQTMGMQSMMGVADREMVKFHMALEHNLFEIMAQASAQAVHGMQPKINVWTNETGPGAFAPIANLMTSLPPIFDAITSRMNIEPLDVPSK